MNLRSLFTEHPASVGETYFQHLGSAAGFAGTMFLGGMACLLHAIFPFAFQRTGSTFITQLHERMVTNRARNAARTSVRTPASYAHPAHPTHAARTHRAGAVAR